MFSFCFKTNTDPNEIVVRESIIIANGTRLHYPAHPEIGLICVKPHSLPRHYFMHTAMASLPRTQRTHILPVTNLSFADSM